MKSDSLVITALGQDRPGLIAQLSHAINEAGCNIQDSRMSVLGGEFAILMQVSGKWNNLSKLESTLNTLQEASGLTITSKRTVPRKLDQDKIPYTIEVVSIDHPGIVCQLAEYLSAKSINVYDMVSSSQPAPHTGSPIFTLNMTVEIPADLHIATLRDEFMDFCETLNLDAVIEPYKL